MSTVVRKAIIPAAGMGMRFLPATKSIPREMIPLINKPAIQYIVEEVIRSGINNVVMVINKDKRALMEHFDENDQLMHALKAQHRDDVAQLLNIIIKRCEYTYIRQRQSLGLGHAVWAARHAVGREHVAILLPNEIMLGQSPAITQLIKIAQQEKCSVIAVREVPLDEVSRHGIIHVKKQFSPTLFQVRDLVEKPSQIEAPSNLAVVGRYVLPPGIFDALEDSGSGKNDDMQLTDGLQKLLSAGEKVFAYKVSGTRYNIGTPLEWLKSNVTMALQHPDYAQDMMKFLQELDRDFLLISGKADLLRHKEPTAGW